MRKFIAAALILFLISGASATTVNEERVTVDVGSSEVEVFLDVEELTSQRLTYLTDYPVSNLDASSEDTELSCEVTDLQIGSEINCVSSEKNNFTARFSFSSSGFTREREGFSVFRYSQEVFRPTERHVLRVVLPKGAGLVEDENGNGAVISPEGAETGSNGRRIFVEWDRGPDLGDTTNYEIAYRDFSGSINPSKIILLLLASGLMVFAGFITYRRMNREDIEKVYEDLDRDEIKVLELMRESEGEMLQKDIVDELDYSKAKVSEIVSGLVENEILVKHKEGRSNKLSFAKNYSF